MRRRKFNNLSLSLATLGLTACTNPSMLTNRKQVRSSKFRIWWIQGYYPSETEAISQIVAEWEKENNTKVEITFISDALINRDVENALNNGNPPDLLFSITAEFSLYSRLAWRNKLADVSDVIEPVKDIFSPIALKATSYKNGATNQRSYYAVPIAQLADSIHYWRDLLAEVGLSDANIPKDWDGFWQFWEMAQERAKNMGKREIFGIALPMSKEATDTIFAFEQFLIAYGVDLLDDNGDLQIDTPNNRKGIIEALRKYAGFYKNKQVPPKALNWGDSDNNQSFISKSTFMTVNPGLSIPASQQFDKDVYNKKMITMEWGQTPSGKPFSNLVAIKQAVIFADSTNQSMAKSLLSYIIRPNNLIAYLKGAGGRYFPTIPKLLEDPYYKDSHDPHVLAAAKSFQNTSSFYTALNPAYSEVGEQRSWGQAIFAVAQGNLSPEQAADIAINQIKNIFTQWK